MWPGIVIVCEVICENAVEMPFANHDHMVEALPTYRSDDSFTNRILPRRARCDRDFFNTHAFDTLGEVVAVDAVAVADAKTRDFLVREGIDDLLGRPCGVEIYGNVEVNDAPPIMAERDEDLARLLPKL